MREHELSSLLVQIGLERNVEIEGLAKELGSIALPTFIDSQVFRGALLDTLEAHLRAEMEQRIMALREHFDAPQTLAEPQAEYAPAESVALPVEEPASNVEDLRRISTVPPGQNPDDMLPKDATTYWSTRSTNGESG